jgi:hypothetical protein
VADYAGPAGGSRGGKGGGGSVWDQMYIDTMADISVIRRHQGKAAGAASDTARANHRRVVAERKVAIMRRLEKLSEMEAHHVRYEPGTPDEDIPCSMCGEIDSEKDNDILFCDGEGCHRAFHQECLDPPISPARMKVTTKTTTTTSSVFESHHKTVFPTLVLR